MQPAGMTQPVYTPQIAIAGRVSHFDWSKVESLSVSWSIIGCGKYQLQNDTKDPSEAMPPNIALDVYINEWVQIQPFLCSEVTAHQERSSLSKPVFSYDPNDIPVTRNSAKTM